MGPYTCGMRSGNGSANHASTNDDVWLSFHSQNLGRVEQEYEIVKQNLEEEVRKGRERGREGKERKKGTIK